MVESTPPGIFEYDREHDRKIPMHITTVRFKDGMVAKGFLSKFRPQDGWFALRLDGFDSAIRFSDCESVTTEGERLPGGKIGDLDELERAKLLGWVPE